MEVQSNERSHFSPVYRWGFGFSRETNGKMVLFRRGFGASTYVDDVTVAPRNLVTGAEERAEGLEELADLGFHLMNHSDPISVSNGHLSFSLSVGLGFSLFISVSFFF